MTIKTFIKLDPSSDYEEFFYNHPLDELLGKMMESNEITLLIDEHKVEMIFMEIGDSTLDNIIGFLASNGCFYIPGDFVIVRPSELEDILPEDTVWIANGEEIDYEDIPYDCFVSKIEGNKIYIVTSEEKNVKTMFC